MKNIIIEGIEYKLIPIEKKIEKDYEILSFNNGSGFTTLRAHGRYLSDCTPDDKLPIRNVQGDGMGATLEEMLTDKDFSNYKIHSVKRLSDDEIFTIGDKISYQKYPKEIREITYFSINNNIMEVNDGIDQYTFNLKEIYKAKKPLFTTADGVDIYEGDEYFYVYLWEIDNRTALPGNYLAIDNYYFSTREKAEEYIYWNEPVLSLNEVATIYKGLTYLRDNTPQKPGQQALDLLKLVKSKYE